jgi:hypothetical protein
MPTKHKAQLTEPETPMPVIWDRMFEGLIPNARAILDCLGYYVEGDLQIPGQDSELTEDEKRELEPVARVLMEAAAISVQMRAGVLVSTLDRVAKDPSLFFDGQLPAAVQWTIAKNYQRGDERPGSFCMDIWGDGQTVCAYSLAIPTEANIRKAAEAARSLIEKQRSSGRPHNQANRIVAEGLGTIFRSSGHSNVRRRVPTDRLFDNKIVYVEKGPFHSFLELVLPPLNMYLREQRLPPVTIESVVRLAAKPGL